MCFCLEIAVGTNMYQYVLFSPILENTKRGPQAPAEKWSNFVLSSHLYLIGDQNDVQELFIYCLYLAYLVLYKYAYIHIYIYAYIYIYIYRYIFELNNFCIYRCCSNNGNMSFNHPEHVARSESRHDIGDCARSLLQVFEEQHDLGVRTDVPVVQHAADVRTTYLYIKQMVSYDN